MSQNKKKKVDRHDTSVSGMTIFTGTGRGLGGGGILIPYSRYYFTLIYIYHCYIEYLRIADPRLPWMTWISVSNSYWHTTCVLIEKSHLGLYSLWFPLKVVLHQTIRKDDFSRNTVLECWNNVATIRNSQQYVVMLVHCTKNPRCADRHRVTS